MVREPEERERTSEKRREGMWDWEDKENTKQKLQEPGRATERVLDSVPGLKRVVVEDSATCCTDRNNIVNLLMAVIVGEHIGVME